MKFPRSSPGIGPGNARRSVDADRRCNTATHALLATEGIGIDAAAAADLGAIDAAFGREALALALLGIGTGLARVGGLAETLLDLRAAELGPLPTDRSAFCFVGDRGLVGTADRHDGVGAFGRRAAGGEQANEENGSKALDHGERSADGVAASLATPM